MADKDINVKPSREVLISGLLATSKQSLSSWEESIKDPVLNQRRALQSLLQEYAKTEYGEQHEANRTQSLEDFRRNFPVTRYSSIRPLLEQVKEGNFHAFLSEKPLNWVLTRGTTGEPKVFPITTRHLREIFECGSRAVLNYALSSGGTFMLDGRVLNLNFPSNVRTLDQGDSRIVFGYSSGTYAKLNPMFRGLSLIPRQEDIDALGTDLTREGWNKRYDFIYDETKSQDVVCIIGVAPVQASFGRYIKRRYGQYPKDLWKTRVIFSTSVPKIQTKYSHILKSLYGDAPVVEMYTATEGAFAQQKDAFPYVVPNYDTYLFEVMTRKGAKMLHEMKRGEWGRLIVSTSIVPRYDIGDMVECMGRNYFRVFGRAKARTILEHVLYRAFYRWFL